MSSKHSTFCLAALQTHESYSDDQGRKNIFGVTPPPILVTVGVAVV